MSFTARLKKSSLQWRAEQTVWSRLPLMSSAYIFFVCVCVCDDTLNISRTHVTVCNLPDVTARRRSFMCCSSSDRTFIWCQAQIFFLIPPPPPLSSPFLHSPPQPPESKLQLRSMTRGSAASRRQRPRRSAADLIFKTLFYIMHQDGPFLKTFTHKTPAPHLEGRGAACRAFFFSPLAHTVFKIISGDNTKGERKRGEREREKEMKGRQ